ncbi:MAG TPA: FliH/SctL family protein [Arthrobacter sp.]
MTSSTEVRYAPVAYPSLKAPGQDRSDSVAYATGHLAGFTDGVRKATAAADVRRQEMEAEHAAVLRHGQARTDRSVDLLAGAVQAVQNAVLPVVADAQDALIAAALDLAEAIIGVELGDGELSARAALVRALADVPAGGTVTVRMNPTDYSILGEIPSVPGAVIIADPDLGRGDAVADFEHGHLNARIGTAMDRARQALLGVTS